MYVLNATCILDVMHAGAIELPTRCCKTGNMRYLHGYSHVSRKEIKRDGREESRRRENWGKGRRIIEKNKENIIQLNKRRIISLVTVISPGLLWGRNFYLHTHPIFTENPVTIPT